MSRLLYRLGGFCVRRRWPVLLAWIAIAVLTVVLTSSVGKQTSDNLTLPGTGSTQAQDLLNDNLPKEANGTNPVVMEAKSGKLTSSANSTVVKRTVHSLAAAPHVTTATSPLSSKGADALSDAECLALLLATGIPGQSALDQAQALLAAFGSIAAVADREVQELAWVGGLGIAKAVRLGAAIELSRRLRARPNGGRVRLSSPEEVAAYFGPGLEGKKKEVFDDPVRRHRRMQGREWQNTADRGVTRNLSATARPGRPAPWPPPFCRVDRATLQPLKGGPESQPGTSLKRRPPVKPSWRSRPRTATA
jgi:hypothetical protein